MATVSWTPDAIASLGEEMVWIAERNPLAAQRISDQLRSAAERLDQFPNRGRRGLAQHTREIIVREYVITYQIRAS
jgi:toxin ParE1/3/4